MITAPATIRRLAQRYHDAGHQLYIVGGAVRDSLLNRKVSDYDFTTSAPPQITRSLFRRTIPTGIEHGTITVIFEGKPYEITTFRVDGKYRDFRRPEQVTFTSSLYEDLKRRDFTINAIAFDPLTGDIHDPFDGRSDLKARLVRTVGYPQERFAEDALRMIRAIRFTSILEFTLDSDTELAIPPAADTIVHVARERVRQELEKLMESRRPSVGWHLLEQTGLLAKIVPELLEDRDPVYRDAGGPPVFDHLVAACDCAPQDDPVLRWSALFHDVAKPRTFGQDERGIHFHNHDAVSAELAEEIMERLRFSNDMIRLVGHLIRHHMFGYEKNWTDGAVRRFTARVEAEHVSRLIALRRIDICGKTGRPPVLSDLDHLEERIRKLLRNKPPLTVGNLAVNGRDIMEELGVPGGPIIGIILRDLLQTVLDDPSMNTPEHLMPIVKNLYRERIQGK